MCKNTKMVPTVPKKAPSIVEQLEAPRVASAQIVNRRPGSNKRALEPHHIPVVAVAAKAGHTIESLGAMCGVTGQTFSKWLKAAEAEDCTDDLLLELRRVFLEGRASLNDMLLGFALAHAAEDPKFCAHMMAVHMPEYNVAKKTETKKVDGSSDASPKDVSNLSEKEIELYIELETKRLGG